LFAEIYINIYHTEKNPAFLFIVRDRFFIMYICTSKIEGMNQITKYLHQPYPCGGRRWKTIAISSLSVFAVLLVFQPFGISRINDGWKFWVVLGYGAVTAVVLSFQFYLLPLLFPRFYDESRWTVGRNMLNTSLSLILVSWGNIAYGYAFGVTWQRLDVSVFPEALLITLAVGIIPIMLITILRQNRLLAVSLREAGQLSDSLAAAGSSPQAQEANAPLSLQGTGKDDLLEINSGHLLYAEAYGNYVKIHYRKNNVVVQKTLRTTVKQIEDATGEYPHIVRCHRAFLVNLEAVKQVSGNSQGYRLTLNGTGAEVPVSRAYTSVIKNKIEQFSR
jgi:hypothetical protein